MMKVLSMYCVIKEEEDEELEKEEGLDAAAFFIAKCMA
jgi:hypothetical protein